MVTKELLHYVVRALMAGVSQVTLESGLTKQGWSLDDVKLAVRVSAEKLRSLRKLQVTTSIFLVVSLLSGLGYVLLPPQAGTEQTSQTKQRSLANFSTPSFFVAPNGSDANPGTLAQPFATLTAARDAIRTLGQDGVTVYVRGGTYPIATTLEFTSADSGTASLPNVYRNYPGEYPVFTGATSIELDPGLSGDQVFDLSDYGMSGKTIYGAFLDGERQVLARTPNAVTPNYAQSDPWLGSFAKVASGIDTSDNKTELMYESGSIVDPATWSTPTSARVFAYTGENWWANKVGVASVDPGNNIISLSASTSYDFAYTASGYGQRSFFYVENQPEFLDTDGEWVQVGDTLTYRVSGTTTGNEVLTLSHTSRLMRVNDASHIVFRNLSLSEVGAVSQSDLGYAFRVDDADNILLDGLQVTNTEGIGLQVAGASEEIVIKNSRITNVRGSAIRVDTDTTGDAYFKPLGDTNIIVENNYISGVGFDAPLQNGGIYANAPGVEVRHNTVENLTGHGIQADVRQLNVVIEYNTVRDVMRQRRDGGGIYLIPFSQPGFTRSWLARGARVDNNLVENTGGYGYNADAGAFEFNQWSWGIYLDDGMSESVVSNNVVRGAARECFLIHSGMLNTFENNICYHTSTVAGAFALAEDPHNSQTSPYGTQDPRWVEVQNLESNGYDAAAWMARYPSLADVPEIQEPGLLMVNNTIERNIFVIADGAYPDVYAMRRLSNDNAFLNNTYFYENADPFRATGSMSADCTGTAPNYYCPSSSFTLTQWRAEGFDTSSQVADPLFTDIENGDYTLAAGSPALTLGFVPISLSSNGPANVAASVGPVSLTDTEVQAGTEVTVSWAEAGFGEHETYRYRLLDSTNAVVRSSIATDDAAYTLDTTGLSAGDYRACVQARNDVRVPSTGVQSDWGTETCSTVLAVVLPPAPASPSPSVTSETSTLSPTSTPTTTTTPRSTVTTSPNVTSTPGETVGSETSPSPDVSSSTSPSADTTLKPSPTLAERTTEPTTAPFGVPERTTSTGRMVLMVVSLLGMVGTLTTGTFWVLGVRALP